MRINKVNLLNLTRDPYISFIVCIVYFIRLRILGCLTPKKIKINHNLAHAEQIHYTLPYTVLPSIWDEA